jgi:hypothetical protein
MLARRAERFFSGEIWHGHFSYLLPYERNRGLKTRNRSGSIRHIPVGVPDPHACIRAWTETVVAVTAEALDGGCEIPTGNAEAFFPKINVSKTNELVL